MELSRLQGRQARQYHAPGWPPVRGSHAGRGYFEQEREGQTGGQLTHLPVRERRHLLSQCSVGKGCSGEGVIFPLRPSCSAERFSEQVQVQLIPLCPGSAPSSGCNREVGLGKGTLPSLMTNIHIFTDPTHVKAPDLTQTLLYVTPPSARLLASPCKCAMKAPCRCEITTHQLHF